MSKQIDQVGVITGATSGIGRATALALAARGMRLFLLGRDPDRARRLVQRLRTEFPTARTEFLPCELSDLGQIGDVASAIRATAPCVHLLVNNAHARFESYQASADGVELTFAVNHLSHFVLTALLLESLLSAPEARIINVAGESYRWAHSDFERCLDPSAFDRKTALYNSKLANVVFTIELARRLQGSAVTVNAVHPGIVATRAGSNGRWIPLLKHYLYYGWKRELLSPRHGADPIVHLATAPDLRGITGCYFNRWQAQETSAEARRPEVAAQLWELSVRLAHLGPEIGNGWRYFALPESPSGEEGREKRGERRE